MRRRLRLAALCGLVLGVPMILALNQQGARGQGQDRAPQWEYEVLAFSDHQEDAHRGKHVDRVNKLAAEGWEYVGLLTAGSKTYVQGDQMRPAGSVLFRRLKK